MEFDSIEDKKDILPKSSDEDSSDTESGLDESAGDNEENYDHEIYYFEENAIGDNNDDGNREDEESTKERLLQRRLFQNTDHSGEMNEYEVNVKKDENNEEKINCGSPLLKLYSTFSPSFVKYIEQNYEPFSMYPFMQGIDLSQMNGQTQYESMLNPIPNNGISDQVSEQEKDLVEQTEYTPTFYPGSMFAGPSSDMINPEQIESYLNGGATPTSADAVNYTDEVVNTSEQIWPVNNMEYPDTTLPPVMFPNYTDVAMLQQEYQNSAYWNQCVLPVYFHPLMMQEEKKSKTRKRKSKKKANVEESVKNLLALHDGDNNAMQGEQNFGGMSEIHPSDEELLNRCKEALIQHDSDRENLPATKEDTMKYLEEAALKLLKASDQYGNEDKKKHNCKVCGRWFNRLYTLETHMRVHNGSKPFLCQICGKRFRQSGTKLNHIRAVHEKERPFKCFFCGKRFSHKSSMVVHERIHTKVKPFQCETCGRRFTDRATFQKHKPIHLGIKPFACALCPKHFSQKSNLKRHFTNLHKGFDMKEYIV